MSDTDNLVYLKSPKNSNILEDIKNYGKDIVMAALLKFYKLIGLEEEVSMEKINDKLRVRFDHLKKMETGRYNYVKLCEKRGKELDSGTIAKYDNFLSEMFWPVRKGVV